MDGTSNEGGRIEDIAVIELQIGDHSEEIRLPVMTIASSNIFLGYDWLAKHNPEIDWKKGEIEFTRCPTRCLDLGPDAEEVRGMTDGDLEKEIPPYLAKYAHVFSERNFEKLPEHRPWDHTIELLPGFQPSDCKAYPLSPKENAALKGFIEENLKSGRIRHSKSPMASPFFFVDKKDILDLRPCQDYRELNEGTVKDTYPFPLISDLMDKLKGAKYFTKLDIRWGYNNIRIREGDEWKAAFRTNRGLFEPLVMFFGLCNSPATFQTMMNEIFHDLIVQGKIAVYMDNIVIPHFTENPFERNQIINQVLDICQTHDLYLKGEKCEFFKKSIEVLGFIITEQGI